MKTTDLVDRQYYRIEYKKNLWSIFRFDNETDDIERVRQCYSISNDWNGDYGKSGQKLLFGKVTWFIGEHRRVTLATEFEKQWLLACIKAGKLVEKPINNYYEIY